MSKKKYGVTNVHLHGHAKKNVKKIIPKFAQRASLITLDKDMKVAFEKLCKLNFPCLKECKMDDNDPCPKDWILKSDEFGTPQNCLPPDYYNGSCDEHTKFIGLNSTLKESLAYECDIKWPCEIGNLK
ncbi:hypothetical protein PFUGPA_03806 [Plasmodium falciparum Palo Alto/Uganda]|uniref:CPW-WPC domain-containing protein n=1 Tax=Plasmodium falciparum (isolate Palo Alto / Uganda) TaxID=57270 RepID=W4IVB2_PLAFP|nr:hypothetical protein PFUGPA_03806 [Plasmodium falciparum Palo Alto/Uganda]